MQALVGQMYDQPQYTKHRDAGFQIFYMFINVGGFFAPFIAVGLRNWWLKTNGFDYNAALPELCHKYLAQGDAMNATNLLNLQKYASNAITVPQENIDLTAFCNQYLEVFNRGFQYAFMAAIVAMFISLVIYILNKKIFPDPKQKTGGAVAASKEEIQISATEIKQRIWALFAVFGIVIFFWFSFHQNGYSLTYFARDYINLDLINISLGFTTLKGAELFQCVNPFFVVLLTPVIMWFFGTLRKKGLEPSTPRKIGIGMGIAALGYVFLLLCSVALPAKEALTGMSSDQLSLMRITPWVMVGMYFILTVAELFISPLGLSFVSKVAPPHLQGLMQGCWLAATAIGNLLLFIGGILYTSVSLWACWLVFAVACGASMLVMLLMVKWLERVAK